MQYDKVSVRRTKPDLNSEKTCSPKQKVAIKILVKMIDTSIVFFQLYVNNAAYVYNEETGEIEMLSQVDSVDDLQVE